MRHRKQRPGGQPTPGPTHQMPHRGAPSLRCPPVLRSAAPGAAPPPARRHDGAWDGSTQGALRKMRRQGVATPGAPHRVSVGGAPSLCLPRPPHTAPLRRLPPAPPPCALVSSPEKVITVQCQNSCNLSSISWRAEKKSPRQVCAKVPPPWLARRWAANWWPLAHTALARPRPALTGILAATRRPVTARLHALLAARP